MKQKQSGGLGSIYICVCLCVTIMVRVCLNPHDN